MPRSRTLLRGVTGLAVVASVFGVTACAPEAQPTPRPTTSAAPETPEPEPYAGPLHFVGDELVGFLLTADEITSMVADADGLTEPSATLQQISDGHGAMFAPEICGVILAEASLGSVGARSITWTTPNEREGRYLVLQFADAGQAQRRMDDFVAAGESCAQFTVDGEASSFEAAVIDDEGEGGDAAGDADESGDGGAVRAVAGSYILGGGEESFRFQYGVAAVGNVVVELLHPFAGAAEFDADAAAQLLFDRASEAKEALVAELTANPPTAPAPASDADPAAPWSTWELGFPSVGPLRLGDDVDAVTASIPGAEVIEPENGIGEWQVVDSAGGARLHVIPEEGGTAVASIRAGDIGLYGGEAVDGSLLPRAGGVGVGDPVVDAIEAFPGGTSVHIVSAGLDLYEVSTREGRVLTFHTDRAVAEEGATIIGITAEDGTLRREFAYSN